MIIPHSKEEVEKLIRDQVQESLHLEYKSSPALISKNINEIAKDVSSFANADGGVIIYGVVELGHLPTQIDEGIDHSKITREWLEQILASNITPPIQGIVISKIDITVTTSIYSIYIPKSNRPHQASDKRYYKRSNFISSPMDHYEIEDVRNRIFKEPNYLNLYLEARGNFVELVIENMGPLPIYDLEFSLPENFKWHYGQIPYSIKNGIKSLAPGRKLSYRFSTLFLSKSEESSFSLKVTYSYNENEDLVYDDFYFNMTDFIGTTFAHDNYKEIENAIDNGFKNMISSLKTIESGISKIASKMK